MNLEQSNNDRNGTICEYLTYNKHGIIELFNKTFSNPSSKIYYALVYYYEEPQFYFLEALNQDLKPVGERDIIGYFKLEEIKDSALFDKKIDFLKQTWCQ